VLQLEGVVHILNTSNNIVLTLTDKEGRVKAWTTPSSVGYKNAKKRLPVAAETAAGELAKRALALGYSTVAVKIKGIGTMTQYAVQMLSSSGIKITQLVDVTPVPYGGCRPSRKRRV
uniref:uS11m n=1 Tax=Polytomella magna TaxID=353565 RepID=UPI002240E39D|nr:Chain Bk, uS11m [Polytomella magna]8APN_Bk Chain Bk, uS11m [Polytomella magna]8APO_Bk Chain Bk, uS11m [Polytomella magna]